MIENIVFTACLSVCMLIAIFGVGFYILLDKIRVKVDMQIEQLQKEKKEILDTLIMITTAYKETQENFGSILIDKTLETQSYNNELAVLLNELIPVSKIISQQEGWKLNKELAKLVHIVQQFQRIEVKVKESMRTDGQKV